LQLLPACEGQEAPSQVRAVKTRLQRRIDQTLIVGLVLERRMQQVEIPDDNRQKIVEIMGEPARQLADGLQFLGMVYLTLHTLPLRYVPHRDLDRRPAFVFDDRQREIDVDARSIETEELRLDRRIVGAIGGEPCEPLASEFTMIGVHEIQHMATDQVTGSMCTENARRGGIRED